MHIFYRKTCRVCGSEHLAPVVDLGDQYLQGSFIQDGYPIPPARKIPSQLVRCDVTKDENGCGLVQLAHSVPPEILYANYWYQSGINQTMTRHLTTIAQSVTELLGGAAKARVLDIGCNDGTLLGAYPDSYAKFGVDPSDVARSIPAPVTVISSTFPSVKAEKVIGLGTLDAVTSIAMYYDLEDPVGFTKSIKHLLNENGIWVVEMSYLPLMLRQNSFDTICHEHLEYYSLAVLENIAKRAGMRVFHAVLNEINGGSIRLYLTHEGVDRYDTPESRAFLQTLRLREFGMELDTDSPYQAFRTRIEACRTEFAQMTKEILARGETIHVYGASTKGNVLLQYYGLDHTNVVCAAERNEKKDGAKTLGTDIPIVMEAASRAMNPDYYLVLPWHFKAEFLERERATIEAGTKMIFPLPDVVIVDANNIDQEIERAKNFDPMDY